MGVGLKEINCAKVHYIIVCVDDDGQRVDNFIRKRYPNLPRSRIYQMLRKGEARVNKKRAKPTLRLKTSDVLRLPPIVVTERVEKAVPAYWLARVKDCVLLDNEDFLIVNKPAGIAVHAGSKQAYGLIDAVKALWGDDYAELAHRLDRDTSGCLVLGKHRQALLAFQQAMKAGAVGKYYQCLVGGSWSTTLTTVEMYLQKGVVKGGERMVAGRAGGKLARTQFSVLKQYPQATLLQAKLDTGRTHQIRAAVQAQGFGIAGDGKYGDKGFNQWLKSLGYREMFLHATRLRFVYAGAMIDVCAPLPSASTDLLQQLERNV